MKGIAELSEKTLRQELSLAMNDTRESIAILDAMALFKSKKSNSADIAKALSFDPNLGQRIIVEVNSPFYGLKNKVKDLTHAISMLGFKRAQELLAASAKHEMYKHVESSYYELLGFKRHCIAVGCFAEHLAKIIRLDNPKEFFVAGTLHDIGKYFYLNRAGAQFEKLVKEAQREKIPLFQIERRYLKTDHAEIGSILAENWKLPEVIRPAIRYHHEITETQLEKLTSRETAMVKVITFANQLAHGHKDGSGARVSLNDLPDPPGILTPDDLAKIILYAEAQYVEEIEARGLGNSFT